MSETKQTQHDDADLAEQALDAACALIHQTLGVSSGDLAGAFFSCGEVQEKLVEYIRIERESA